jgi:hypothetical protein
LIPLSGADLPGGGRRAGLLAHSYEAQLIWLQTLKQARALGRA